MFISIYFSTMTFHWAVTLFLTYISVLEFYLKPLLGIKLIIWIFESSQDWNGFTILKLRFKTPHKSLHQYSHRVHALILQINVQQDSNKDKFHPMSGTCELLFPVKLPPGKDFYLLWFFLEVFHNGNFFCICLEYILKRKTRNFVNRARSLL